LESPVGPAQALLMTAVYFGLAHFYEVPYGVIGVIMSFIPGWFLGKSMLETRGYTWVCFIHYCMDIVIFFFIAWNAPMGTARQISKRFTITPVLSLITG